MKNRTAFTSFFVAALLTTAALPLRADSIDEAEAKRRGVPVAQVIAERLLEAEKRKTADLEKQIAELRKKLAEGQGTAVAPGPATPASTPPAGTPASITTVAAANTTEGLNFDGPRQVSPLYDDFVKRYLTGDWANLPADLAAKQKEITALPAGNAADLQYIRNVLAESRQPWWEQTKLGKAIQIKPLIWKLPINVAYSNGPGVRFGRPTNVNGTFTYALAWDAAGMDSTAPLPAAEIAMTARESYGFTMGDAVSNGVWSAMGGFYCSARRTAEKVQLSPEETALADRYTAFWQSVTAAYYTTPAGRRYEMFRAVTSLNPRNNMADVVGRRPLGSMLIVELLTHKDRYPSLKYGPVVGLPDTFPPETGMNGESFIATSMFSAAFLNARLTLAEDRLLRETIKTFAEANSAWKTDKINLPNGLANWLDPAADAGRAQERYTWMREQLKPK